MKYAADFRRIAREALRGRWGVAVIAGLIASLLGAIGSGGPELNIELDNGHFQAGLSVAGQEIITTDGMHWGLFAGITAYILIFAILMGIVLFVLGSVIEVGYYKFNLDLVDRREEIKTLSTPEAEELLRLEEEIAHLDSQQKEIGEAILAGYAAFAVAEKILSELDSADGWNTWDMFSGGGLITHMAKHGHLDDAQDLVETLQDKLRSFKTELADVSINADMQVNIDGFLRFADYFFDGLFADWAVADRISESMSAVQKTRNQIGHLVDKLTKMKEDAERREKRLRDRADAIVVEA